MKKDLVRKIAVGSKNPVKLGAVKRALEKLFSEAEFLGVEVASGVPAQPRSDEETLKGAKNRARRALKEVEADIGVGLEGGIIEARGGMMNTVWCCLLTREGIETVAGGLHFQMPPVIVEGIRRGQEIGEIIDEIYKGKNLKHKQGMIGLVTKGVIDRTEAYMSLIKLATIKFQSPELY